MNAETALSVEKVVRDNGAIPATIAIIQGRIKVGNESKFDRSTRNVNKA